MVVWYNIAYIEIEYLSKKESNMSDRQPRLPKILLIDDEEVNMDLLERFLGKGYDFQRARDGAEGIARAKTEKFDLVITDYQMPEKNGFAVAHELEGVAPVIMVTSSPAEKANKAMRQENLTIPIFSRPFERLYNFQAKVAEMTGNRPR